MAPEPRWPTGNLRHVLIGAHVRGGGTLVDRLERGVEVGADAIQIFTQSPRQWKPTQYAPDVLAKYREAARRHPSVRATYCHATYLINIATDDDDLYGKSVTCLTNNLGVARGMAASGLVLHIGSHKGSGIDDALPRVAAALTRALEEADDPGDQDAPRCPILLENAAGAGGTVGRTLQELEAVIETAGGDDRLGICVDTQHLFASGVTYATVESADGVVEEVRTRFGLDRLGCMHLNDSKVPSGSNRDRHENLGEGLIGGDALGALIGHPELAASPALLEVPGEGDGPRAVDVTAARRILAAGASLRGVAPPDAVAALDQARVPSVSARVDASPQKRAPARKAATARAQEKPAVKKGAVRGAAVKKAPAKRAPTKKAAVKRAAARTGTTKKAVAKKAAVKKAAVRKGTTKKKAAAKRSPGKPRKGARR